MGRKMRTLLLCPHQDDEILSATGLIYNSIQEKNKIFVVFATNGDRHGMDMATIRHQESMNALKTLGVLEDEIFYLGYGNTGMKQASSFLYRLLMAQANETIPSFVSQYTYHPAGMKTVHNIRTGKEAIYSHQNFLDDLTWIILKLAPDIIVTPSMFDSHSDHYSLTAFLKKSKASVNVNKILSYLIHAGDDMSWPNRNKSIFSRPVDFPLFLWDVRLRIKLKSELQTIKKKLIQSFHSQNPTALKSFLLSFVRDEEIFFSDWSISPPCKDICL